MDASECIRQRSNSMDVPECIRRHTNSMDVPECVRLHTNSMSFSVLCAGLTLALFVPLLGFPVS